MFFPNLWWIKSTSIWSTLLLITKGRRTTSRRVVQLFIRETDKNLHKGMILGKKEIMRRIKASMDRRNERREREKCTIFNNCADIPTKRRDTGWQALILCHRHWIIHNAMAQQVNIFAYISWWRCEWRLHSMKVIYRRWDHESSDFSWSV